MVDNTEELHKRQTEYLQQLRTERLKTQALVEDMLRQRRKRRSEAQSQYATVGAAPAKTVGPEGPPPRTSAKDMIIGKLDDIDRLVSSGKSTHFA